MTIPCKLNSKKTAKSLIHERRGGPGAPGALFFLPIFAIICLPFTLAISAAFIMVPYMIKSFIKQVMPEYELNAGDSMIIILVEVIVSGCGVYLYTSTHTDYRSFDPFTLWLGMGEIILITGMYSVGKFITEGQNKLKASLKKAPAAKTDFKKVPKLSRNSKPEAEPIEIGFSKDPQSNRGNNSKGQAKVKIKPPRTSQKILLVVMVSLIMGCVIYLIALQVK